jgi:uncharacterized protein YegL
MPRLMNDGDMQRSTITGLANFTFSGTRIDSLGATEYTLVTIAIDVTGSVYGMEDDIRNSLIEIVDSCQKSPRASNLLLRVMLFSSSLAGGIEEIHGFKPLAEIDANAYPQLHPSGMTPLFDATYSAVGSVVSYGKQLMDDDYLANGIVFIITDGMDNQSVIGKGQIKQIAEKAMTDESIESLISILIGLNTASCSQYLADFRQEAGLTQYLDVGDATPAKLAKLADFVSQSISSQSQSLGTGGPSQAIALSI